MRSAEVLCVLNTHTHSHMHTYWRRVASAAASIANNATPDTRYVNHMFQRSLLANVFSYLLM